MTQWKYRPRKNRFVFGINKLECFCTQRGWILNTRLQCFVKNSLFFISTHTASPKIKTETKVGFLLPSFGLTVHITWHFWLRFQNKNQKIKITFLFLFLSWLVRFRTKQLEIYICGEKKSKITSLHYSN